ncbi:MAG: hypothetical protein AVDCRST_MAG39-2696, partial [uncultured Sphingomonadaceae bacterium]
DRLGRCSPPLRRAAGGEVRKAEHDGRLFRGVQEFERQRWAWV